MSFKKSTKINRSKSDFTHFGVLRLTRRFAARAIIRASLNDALANCAWSSCVYRLVKVAFLVSVFLGLGVVEAVAGGSVTIPLPLSAHDAATLVPTSARSVEFLAGMIAGVLVGEFGRFAWRWATAVWAASLNWGSHALRYGSIAAALVALIFFL